MNRHRLHLVSSEPHTELTTLVGAARAGDRAAFRALYEHCFAWVERLAFRLLPHRGEAEDLMQDAFTHAFVTLGRLEDPARFEGWLRRIVVGTAHKRTRRLVLFKPLRSASEPIDFDTYPSPSADPETRAELIRLMTALERLPATERLMFVLRRIEGMTVPEIAESCEVSEATVKRRLATAVERLTARGVLS